MKRVALLALLLTAGTARAGSVAPPKLESWQLPNGLRVAHIQVDRAPVVAVQMWYRVGSAVEPAGKHGLAKLVEILMTRGSAHVRPGDHERFIAEVGGVARASTLEDATGFHDLVPAGYLDLAVRLEADRMRGLEWRQSELDTVRKTLGVQLPQLTGDPTKQAVWRLDELLYGSHGYAHEPLGDKLDLDAIKLADLKKFYDTYYVPNNALLVVVGAVTRAQVTAAADKYLAPIARAADPPAVTPPADKPTAQRRTLEPGPIGLIFHGWRIPEARHKDIYALQMASLVLGIGHGSRLVGELVDTRRVAMDAGCSAVLHAQPGTFVVFASFEEPALAKDIETALAGQVAELARTPVTDAELERARNQMRSELVPRLETATGLANQAGLSWALTGDAGMYLRDVASLEAVTAADIQKAAATWLNSNTRVTVVIPPGAQ
ncbi:MAG TPA: pitrilysin family protein [Kofleriaceae bacterium]|jgi:zinc protease|nr:pitrilysin family protein [Kofleriaceae bacterium]